MSKVVYIIPGFTEKTTEPAYQKIINFFKSNNFRVVPVDIIWPRRVMSDYLEQFLTKYQPNKNDQVYLFGFSFGAMVAFLAAAKIKPKVQILCSLSPYFKEDLPKLKKSSLKIDGKRRIDDFKNISFNERVKNINCQTILFIGGKENKSVFRRVNDAHKKIGNSELIIIDKAKHKISQMEYLNRIKAVIFGL